MNWDQIAGNWKQVRGRAKEQWGKLTDDDLDAVAGRRDQLAGKIRESATAWPRTRPSGSLSNGNARQATRGTPRTRRSSALLPRQSIQVQRLGSSMSG